MARARKKRRRRRSFRLTREGKVFVSVAMGVGIAAVNTGNNLLYLVLGLLLSLLLLSGTLSDLVLYKLRVRRRMPERLFAGSTALIELSVTNRKGRIPTYAVEVEDLAEGEKNADRRCFFLKVSAGSTQRTTYRRTPPRRGLLKMRSFVVRTRYPFGLIEKAQHYTREESALVYPALEPFDVQLDRGVAHGDDASTSAPGQGMEVLGLRDYREGDEGRAIHWQRSAAFDRLLVRETARQSRGRLALMIDTRRRDELDWSERFESAIRRCAYLVDWALEQGIAVQVVTPEQQSVPLVPGDPPDPAWEFLALLEPSEGDLEFEEIGHAQSVWVEGQVLGAGAAP